MCEIIEDPKIYIAIDVIANAASSRFSIKIILKTNQSSKNKIRVSFFSYSYFVVNLDDAAQANYDCNSISFPKKKKKKKRERKNNKKKNKEREKLKKREEGFENM